MLVWQLRYCFQPLPLFMELCLLRSMLMVGPSIFHNSTLPIFSHSIKTLLEPSVPETWDQITAQFSWQFNDIEKNPVAIFNQPIKICEYDKLEMNTIADPI